MGPNRGLFITFLGGSLFILFFNLWGRTLENHDYLRYAEVAKEMIQSGDWVVPRYNGQVFIHKPPFLFWLIAFPSKAFGHVTPFLARLPSAFFAWIGVAVVYLWGRKVWGDDRSGFIASGILLSSYLYFWQGRIARTDMVFSVLVLLSIYFFYLRVHEDTSELPPPRPSPIIGEEVIRTSPAYGRGRFRNYLLTGLSFAFMGVAGLTKGPVGFLFPLLVMILFLLVQRQARLLTQGDFLLGSFIMALVMGSWLTPFLIRLGWENALEIWKETRILSRQAPFYLYGYRAWVDFAPWSVFFPSLFIYYWKKKRHPDEKFLILWFFDLFFSLTLFPGRSSKYLLPAFPALALLMGGFWRNRSTALFWVLFLCAIAVWHGYELKLVRGNENRSPGILIEKELTPFRRDIFFAYRMDVDTLGKINFYGDPIIPQTNKADELKQRVGGRKEILVVMPRDAAKDLIQGGIRLTFMRTIEHKGINFILAKIH